MYRVVVIGAGQAGLATSRHLQLRGIEHLVLERGRIGETWRTQRWDSFRVNTPNALNGLPGAAFPGNPGRFPTAGELATFYEDYANQFGLPIREGVAVKGVDPAPDGFAVHTTGAAVGELRPAAVVVASGSQNRGRIPAVAATLPGRIAQVHAGAYRNPGELPPGAVLVVGGAQSGCQIVEDLLGAGRRVYFSVSRTARSPRRYRGRDVLLWMDETGFLDQRPEDLPDPALRFVPQPQISGVGERGHTVSYQDLAVRGVTLVGRLVAADARTLTFDDSVAECIRYADAGSAEIRRRIDAYLERRGGTPPPLEPDSADVPCADPESLAGPTSVDVDAIAAVVWATGFSGDFTWLHAPVIGERGPIHSAGVASIPGLLFVGMPWLRLRRSGIIAGAGVDGEFIAAAVARHLGA